ncbi:MAG: murein transglycosylase A [Thermodesulfobacteriota bacterium]
MTKTMKMPPGKRFSVIVMPVVLALLMAAGTSAAAADAAMRRLPKKNWPALTDDLALDRLAQAVSASAAYYRRLPEKKTFAFGPDAYSAADLAAGLQRLHALLETDPDLSKLRSFLSENAVFYVHKAGSQPVDVLFTGYFEPLLEGRRSRTERFCHPVYRRPGDLVVVDLSEFPEVSVQKTIIGRRTEAGLVPYFDRQTIADTDVMADRAEPIAWVADPVALFFLHVQGSGQIRLKDGQMLNVGYDITNGRPYKSIGKYLIDQGKISVEEMSMQAIADYIDAHPGEMREIFDTNPRYVFFKTRPHRSVGCIGQVLTPGRSVALDQSIAPSGSLLYLQAKKPVCDDDGKIAQWVDFSRFAANQDTGSAIRGPGRADIFWGSGGYAQTAAGYMKHRGRLYFVVILPD